MAKKRNYKNVFLLIGIFVFVLIFYLFIKNYGVTIAPPTGGKLVESTPINPNPSILKALTYTCDVAGGTSLDKCDIRGYLSCDVVSDKQRVVARRAGFTTRTQGEYDYIAADMSGDGNLEIYKYSGQSSTSVAKAFKYTFSDNAGIYLYVGRLYYGKNVPSFKGGSYSLAYSGISIDTIPAEGCQGNEICTIDKVYSCSYNFCPQNSPTFEYCSGTLNSKTENFAWSGFTEQVRLNEGEQITFMPKDAKQVALTQDKFNMEITKWDMSCSLDYQNKCDKDSNEVYCLGKTCPSGYTYYSSQTYCSGGYKSDICRDSGYNCVVPITNKYKSCDGVNSNSCPIFSSIKDCTSGQICIPNSGTVGTSGVGYCKCDVSDCSKGDRRLGQLGGDYDECVDFGSCHTWSSRSCEGGLIYDSTKKLCVNKQSDCQVNTERCDGQITQKCLASGIIDEEGKYYYTWQNTENCVTPKTCSKIDDYNAICKCDCEIDSIRCSTTSPTTKYERCTSNCWEEFALTIDKQCVNDELITKAGCDYSNPACPVGQICSNNQCVSAGCAFNTVGYECKKTGEYCDITTSSETYNSCVCKTTDTYCSVIGEKKCKDSTLYYKCSAIENSCPQWSTSTSECQTPRSCVNNDCVCPTENTCGTLEEGNTRCSPFATVPTVQKCNNVNGCFLWQDSSSCELGLICTD